MESNYYMRIRCIIYIHACSVNALVHVYYGWSIYMYISCRSAAMACVLCHKPSLAGHIDAFYIQSHLIAKNSVDFFATFVNRLRD